MQMSGQTRQTKRAAEARPSRQRRKGMGSLRGTRVLKGQSLMTAGEASDLCSRNGQISGVEGGREIDLNFELRMLCVRLE